MPSPVRSTTSSGDVQRLLWNRLKHSFLCSGIRFDAQMRGVSVPSVTALIDILRPHLDIATTVMARSAFRGSAYRKWPRKENVMQIAEFSIAPDQPHPVIDVISIKTVSDRIVGKRMIRSSAGEGCKKCDVLAPRTYFGETVEPPPDQRSARLTVVICACCQTPTTTAQ